MNTTKDRKRAPNFSSKEERILVGLVRKYETVIECKLTDTKTHSDKTSCWSKIEDEFNSSSGDVYLPKDILRKKYDNIKKMVKKKYTDDKCYSLGTGGGPRRYTDFTSVDEEIKEMLGKRIEGLKTEFGGDVDKAETISSLDINTPEQIGDYDTNPDVNEVEHSIEWVEETVQSYIAEQDKTSQSKSSDLTSNLAASTSFHNYACTESNSWAKYNPKMLKQRKHTALYTEVKNKATKNKDKSVPIKDKVSEWVQMKSDVESSKQKYVEKEQELKLQFLREKHELELKTMQQKAHLQMENEKREHDIKMDILKRGHELKVEILKLEKQKLIQKM